MYHSWCCALCHSIYYYALYAYVMAYAFYMLVICFCSIQESNSPIHKYKSGNQLYSWDVRHWTYGGDVKFGSHFIGMEWNDYEIRKFKN